MQRDAQYNFRLERELADDFAVAARLQGAMPSEIARALVAAFVELMKAETQSSESRSVEPGPREAPKQEAPSGARV
jgi:hypothetical protein